MEQNASGGTDHGTAAPMFLIGQGVQGGVYGAYPSLTDLDNGNLRMSTDFRSVYATALADWLRLDPTAILGGDWAKLPLFAKSAMRRSFSSSVASLMSGKWSLKNAEIRL